MSSSKIEQQMNSQGLDQQLIATMLGQVKPDNGFQHQPKPAPFICPGCHCADRHADDCPVAVPVADEFDPPVAKQAQMAIEDVVGCVRAGILRHRSALLAIEGIVAAWKQHENEVG
jgi:hypothetical protein